MRSRRTLFVPIGAVAIVVMLAAATFACTIFRGTFTLRGNASSTRVTATGLRTGMVQTVSSGIAKATAAGGAVTVWAGADSEGVALPRGRYEVRYYNGAGYSDHQHWQTDCMAGGPGVTLGTVTVTKTGRIKGQPADFSLPASTPNTAPQESAVCISDPFAVYGNMAPLTII